jgi:catechol 2,3-dioxygenase-like lactoylglutathione lyase family enzyme
MIKNRKHDHIGLATKDLQATVNWYVDVLGFEVIGDFVAPDGTPCKFLKNTDITYEIFQPVGGVDAEVAGKIDHFAFQSDDIEKDYEFCKEQGYEITTNGIEGIPTFWEHGCRYFKIASPTGEAIEFCEVVKQSKLFCLLPDYVSTPDGMAVHPDGDLVLACPNFADLTMPGCILRITKDRHISKWFDVPVLAETGQARPMGIEFGPDGDLYIVDNQGWSGEPNVIRKGRILRVRMNGDQMVYCKTVAYNMEHPNGIRIWKDKVYVTNSLQELIKDPSGKLVSCINYFGLNEENVEMTNTLADKDHIFDTYITEREDDQYGLDGIAFDKEGNLYVGNFGDGTIWKVKLNEDGSMKSKELFAKDPANLRCTDGMVFDDKGNLYVADFTVNAVGKIYPDGRVERIAQSPDSDGFHGELDQPGEPCFWNGYLVVSCFDTVTGGEKVNTKHEMPATMAMIKLD